MTGFATLRAAHEADAGSTHEAALLAPKRLAHVVSVSGGQAIAVLERRDNDGNWLRVDIGALMKIPTGPTSIIAIVSAVSTPMPGQDGGEEVALLELTLAGEIAA